MRGSDEKMTALWIILFAILTVAMLALTLKTYVRDQRALPILQAALIVATTYVLSNVAVFTTSPHMQFYPIMDGVVASIFAGMWYQNRLSTYLILALLLVADCMAHVWYFSLSYSTHEIRYLYDSILNSLYVVQLAAVSFPAAAHLAKFRKLRYASDGER